MNITATSTTPSVVFDESSSTLVIRGESYPENAFEFFKPVQQWVEQRARASRFVLELAVTYMNTSSVKCVMDLFDRLDLAYEQGADVLVRWRYSETDERIRELGEELLEDLRAPKELLAQR